MEGEWTPSQEVVPDTSLPGTGWPVVCVVGDIQVEGSGVSGGDPDNPSGEW